MIDDPVDRLMTLMVFEKCQAVVVEVHRHAKHHTAPLFTFGFDSAVSIHRHM